MRGVTARRNRCFPDLKISIHTPHARRDSRPNASFNSLTIFQSTRLMRGVTRYRSRTSRFIRRFQSTRLMRGVTAFATRYDNGKIFQSTRLMRGVTVFIFRIFMPPGFQSTRLMRGVTYARYSSDNQTEISIHTPHARRDLPWTMPLGQIPRISIHTPHARRDPRKKKEKADNAISIHTPHARRDFRNRNI